ncbi:MAG: 4Fe-4S binding protein [Clostridia bacterium]|nr:4Fe-4S binding protein [Clostridia bacterium]
MNEFIHSVSLNVSKCKGCTACLRHCPTEAIRIKDGHAVIDSERCIDCGECIRVCPHKAKKAVCSPFDKINDFKYKIALPAPALYGQFNNLEDVDYCLQGLLDIGFDDVYEVSYAAEFVSAYTRMYLKGENIKKPVISSACPVIVRLISLRYPSLCDNIMPIIPPMELAAKFARKKAKREHPELEDKDIGVFFISPCPAKSSYVVNNELEDEQNVDVVLAMNDIYFRLLPAMKNAELSLPIANSGRVGVGWAVSGGEASALLNDKYLAADGLENVIQILEEIDNGKMPDLEFVELNACNSGCVGGILTVENPYIAKAKMRSLRKYLPVSLARPEKQIPEDVFLKKLNNYKPIQQFSDNMQESMRLMNEIQMVCENLPEIDCGSCGAPTCLAFAEDVVLRGVDINNCIINMKDYLLKKLEEKKDENNDG